MNQDPLYLYRARRRLHSAHRRRARPVRLRQVLARRGHPRALGRRLRRVPRAHGPVLQPHGVPRLVHARHHRASSPITWTPGRASAWRSMPCIRAFSGAPGAGGHHPRPVRDVPRRAARGGPGDGRPRQGVPHLHARAVRTPWPSWPCRCRHPDAEPHGGRHHPGRAHRRRLGRHRHRRRRGASAWCDALLAQGRQERGAQGHPARRTSRDPQLRGAARAARSSRRTTSTCPTCCTARATCTRHACWRPSWPAVRCPKPCASPGDFVHDAMLVSAQAASTSETAA